MIGIDFVKAGNATFTFANPEKKRYTFKVKYSEKIKKHFVYVLTGPSNESDYTYMGGLYDSKLALTRASKYTHASLPVKVFNYAMDIIEGYKPLLKGYFLEHDNHCGRCGRKLTTPESIKCGLGPTCKGK